jgi:sigma-B regulation protein RsbU (phosphoserine phosphatase)
MLDPGQSDSFMKGVYDAFSEELPQGFLTKPTSEQIAVLMSFFEGLKSDSLAYKEQLESSSILLETQLEEISKTYEELSTLFEATTILSRSLNPEDLLDDIVELVLNSIPCNLISIVIRSIDKEPIFYSKDTNTNFSDREIHSIEVFLRKYLVGGTMKAILREGPEIDVNLGLEQGKIQSLIIIPIGTPEERYGVMLLANRFHQSLFTAGDRKLLESITNQFHFSLKNYHYLQERIKQERLREEIEIAKKIQNSLLPKTIAQLPGIEISASFSPAIEVAGDYYDVIPKKEGLLLVVADVSGKGIPASLLMSSFRTALKIFVDQARSLKALAVMTNDHVAKNGMADRFVTAMFIYLYQESKTMAFCNAGHDPVLLYRPASDAFFELTNDGLPIGIFEDQSYQEDQFALAQGDVMIAYTDGIPEARNIKKEEFGFERIKAALRAAHKQSATQIRDFVLSQIDEFVQEAPQHDDTTFLVVKVNNHTIE